jgi:hypothetical protein
MVNKLSDVFFKKLTVMPTDCDIEFVIELVSSTASTYKGPYRMAAK